jgi:fumarylacetoacetase
VVTPDALAPFARPAPPQADPQPLPYLRQAGRTNYDVQLEVAVRPGGTQQETVVVRSNLRTLYWTVPQVLRLGGWRRQWEASRGVTC